MKSSLTAIPKECLFPSSRWDEVIWYIDTIDNAIKPKFISRICIFDSSLIKFSIKSMVPGMELGFITKRNFILAVNPEINP